MNILQKLRQLVRGTLHRVVRFSVYKHANVSMPPYDIFSAVIETRKWGFGFRIENWRDRFPAHDEWGLRIQFWKWHLIVALKANPTGLRCAGLDAHKQDQVVLPSESKNINERK